MYTYLTNPNSRTQRRHDTYMCRLHITPTTPTTCTAPTTPLAARLLQEKQMVLQGLSGVPMVASSPQRHDGGPLAGVSGPVDVTGYHPPWKALTEFAQAHDPDRIDPLVHQQYQQLMSQMHGFGTEMIPASDILCQPGHPLAPHLHPQQSSQPAPPPPSQSQPTPPQQPPTPQQQQPPPLQHQQLHPPPQQHQQTPPSTHGVPDTSKFDFVTYDESAHSDSYVSYLESDDSMTAPLSASTSP
ncbi:hypothetical protein FHG87_014789 [Trinorchestia longiramus]|nr:hypothetical protein FHG87_014789 [Trinorchestia longiramus]